MVHRTDTFLQNFVFWEYHLSVGACSPCADSLVEHGFIHKVSKNTGLYPTFIHIGDVLFTEATPDIFLIWGIGCWRICQGKYPVSKVWVGDRARYALKSLIVLRFVGRGTSALEGPLRSRDPGSGSKVGTPGVGFRGCGH
jgi:hypothetical protein